jgi:electron transfer flavoprotein beta subunit
MNIIVCIKQVPDTTDVKINPHTHTLERDGVRTVINPFDLYAIEEALKLKASHGGEVTIITMGPPQAKSALEEAIAMGADDARLVSNRAFAGSDTLATSYILAKTISSIGSFDLVICGKQAVDGDTAQVGPEMAVHLGIPQVMFVRKVVTIEGKDIVVERMTERGYDRVRTSFPCLISVVKDINTPRPPSFQGRMRAKRMEIPVLGPSDLKCDEEKIGLDGSPTWVEHIFAPQARTGCEPVEGDAEHVREVAEKVEAKLDRIWE